MKTVHRNIILKLGLLSAVLMALALLSNHSAEAQSSAQKVGSAPTNAQEVADLTAQAQKNGTVKVIVSLNAPAFDAAVASTAASNAGRSKADLKAAAKATGTAQMALANQARSSLISALASYNAKVYAGSNWFIPAVALTVDPAALEYLKSSPLVKAISPDHQLQAMDNSSVNQVGATLMWYSAPSSFPSGYNGAGETVAILDTGVQDSHPFLSSDGSTTRAVAAWAGCFSGDGSPTTPPVYSNCPSGAASATGALIDGEPCYNYPGYPGCEHGTHVAGIAAGYGGYSGGNNEYGVAWGASIMPVQVFTCYWNGSTCQESAYDTDIISGLNWVHNIWVNDLSNYTAAVNMSLGYYGSDYSSSCDSINSAMTTAINTLRYTDKIATVIAAGNDGFTNGISYPACISSAISVGAVNFQDGIASFSDSGPNMTIFAPGYQVYSSLPTNTYGYLSGTSMATPQVVGAIALLQQEDGHALSVTQLTSIMTKTGRLVYNGGNGLYQPRINVGQAGIVAKSRQDTVGLYRSNTFYLKNANTTGYADQTIAFGYGTDAYPIVGDWPGNAFFDELGVFNRSSGQFTLCHDGALITNASCGGTPAGEIITMTLGNPNDYPIAARWNPRPTSYTTTTIDGNTVNIISGYAPTGVGVFRPTNGLLYLKNALVTGYADYTMVLGIPGDQGLAGDWDQDGQGSPGVHRPSNATFYLSNKVVNGSVYGDIQFVYGNTGTTDLPVVGNWNTYDSTYLGVGAFRTSTGYYYLRNTLTTGYATNAFYFGIASDIPVVGDWTYVKAEPKPPIGPTTQRIPPTILVPRTPTAPNPSGVSIPGGNTIGD